MSPIPVPQPVYARSELSNDLQELWKRVEEAVAVRPPEPPEGASEEAIEAWAEGAFRDWLLQRQAATDRALAATHALRTHPLPNALGAGHGVLGIRSRRGRSHRTFCRCPRSEHRTGRTLGTPRPARRVSRLGAGVSRRVSERAKQLQVNSFCWNRSFDIECWMLQSKNLSVSHYTSTFIIVSHSMHVVQLRYSCSRPAYSAAHLSL